MPRIDYEVHLSPLHDAQQMVVSEAGRFNVLECGRRFGKTALGKNRSALAALAGRPVGWFAPNFKYLSEAWRSLCETLKPVTVKRDAVERRIELITGGMIECWSLTDADAGRSRKYGTVIIDEAGKVAHLKRIWEESIRPTLSDLKGDAWFLGTPKGGGYFHNLYLRGQQRERGWVSWRFGTIDNPFIDEKEIADARMDLPPEVFDQEYRGIPASDAGNPFGLEAIARCFAGQNAAALRELTPAYWGIDLAKWVDWTVLIALDAHGRMCRMHRFQKPWRETMSEIRRIIGRTPALMDSTGVGDPILEFLTSGDVEAPRLPPAMGRLGSSSAERTQAAIARQQAEEAMKAREIGSLTTSCPNLRGLVYTATSKQRLMERLAVALQHGELALWDDVLRAELEAFEYQYNPDSRTVKYSAPEELHDDTVNALALAVECRQSGGKRAQGAPTTIAF